MSRSYLLKKMSKTIKRSLIGLTLVHSLTSLAYLDKDQPNLQTPKRVSEELVEKTIQKLSKSSIEVILDRVTATINKDAKITGPIYRHATRDADYYGDQLVEMILKTAHKNAEHYLAEGNPKAYYAFLALALTVPNQEGLFVHFREVPAQKEYCNDKRSTGEGIKSDTAKSNFRVALNGQPRERNSLFRFFGGGKIDSSDIFLVKCKYLKGVKTYKQLIVGGSDGSDVGMFQLSSRWHYEDFLVPKLYETVQKTVSYGLKYLYKGFKRIVNDQGKKYSCMLSTQGEFDYQNVIRGTWSAYNGGPGRYCRFADKNSPFAPHDSGFKKNLQITLNLNDDGFFGFKKDSTLQLSSNVRAAVEELVENFEKNTNNHSALNALLAL